MISVGMLEDADVIQSGDLVRQLALTYEGQSDYLATNSTYGGGRINRLGWMTVDEFTPYWIGKTVGEFRKRMHNPKRHWIEVTDYEFIRGPVPATHLEDYVENRS